MDKTAGSTALPEDFQERLFKAIAVQRPAVTARIKQMRRKNPQATPAEVMRSIEKQYLATTTSASAAAGASATIPAVGIPTAIGLGVADLLFFYEATALFALSMAELRGIPIEDPERAKAVVLGAMLGEKRKSRITEMVLGALPAGATVRTARTAAGTVAGKVNPKWGDLLAHQLPDSALVPVTMVLAKQAVSQGAVMGGVRVGSKAIPVIGAVAGGATSYYFGKSVVKACREGFSSPVEQWPAWLELDDTTADAPDSPPRALTAVKGAASTVGQAAGSAASAVASGAKKAGGAIAGTLKRVGKR